VSQGVAWSYSEEHTREIQRRETVESAPTRTASLRSEATQHHLATTPRGARAVAFSRVVAPLGGAQVHRVEIGEGKTQKKQKGEPTTVSIGKAQNASPRKNCPFGLQKATPYRQIGSWAQSSGSKPPRKMYRRQHKAISVVYIPHDCGAHRQLSSEDQDLIPTGRGERYKTSRDKQSDLCSHSRKVLQYHT
jgi:hypothetical protein